MTPDAERGPATGPRPDQPLSKHADAAEGTAPPPTVDASAVLVLEAELPDVLADRREVTR